MDWAELLRRIAQALGLNPKPSFWDRISPKMVVVSSVGTVLAASMAALSAWLSLLSLQETRVQREPVLIIEPKQQQFAVEFNDQRGVLLGTSLGSWDLPMMRVENFGPTPALNVTLRFKWLPPTNLNLPQLYRTQRMPSGGPRFAVLHDQLYFAPLAGGTLSSPITEELKEPIGIVPPGPTKEIRWPLGVLYAHEVFALQDVAARLQRTREAQLRAANLPLDEGARQIMATMAQPTPPRALEITAAYDTLSGRHLLQRYVIDSTNGFAQDYSSRSSPQQPSDSRIQAVYDFSVDATTAPRPITRNVVQP